MTEQEFYKKVDGECHEDLIVFIRQKYKSEKEWEYTNQLYLAEGNGFVWQVDWHEGQEDVEILGYIPVREVEPIKHACCKDGKANYSEIPTSSTTKNDLGVDCISRQFMYELGATCIATRNENGNLVALGAIKELPSVTPQEPRIITCKDCKYYRNKENKRSYCTKRLNVDSVTDRYREPNFYCADAVLREVIEE